MQINPKKALTEEQNQIAIRDSLNYARLKRQVDYPIRDDRVSGCTGRDTFFTYLRSLEAFRPGNVRWVIRRLRNSPMIIFQADSLKIIPGDLHRYHL
jgi:hypothetical protein